MHACSVQMIIGHMQCHKKMQEEEIGNNEYYGSGLMRFISLDPSASAIHACETSVPCPIGIAEPVEAMGCWSGHGRAN